MGGDATNCQDKERGVFTIVKLFTPRSLISDKKAASYYSSISIYYYNQNKKFVRPPLAFLYNF